MKLSIIIPTKDRAKIFEQTLKNAVEAVTGLDAEIIVINDSKTSQVILPSSFSQVRLVNNPKAGVASARNLGASLATGQLLLFIDDDILISRESVLHTFSLHQQFSKACFNLNWEYSPSTCREIAALNFGRFLQEHQMTSFRGWYNDPSWKDNQLFVSKSVASFHLSIQKEDFESANGYNELFPHAGFEDYDFPIRLKKKGIAFYIDSRVTVFHNEIDRLGLYNWLNSQEKRAITRKHRQVCSRFCAIL